MSVDSYVALCALIVMVVLYALEHRWPFAQLGFSLSATIVAVSEFTLGHGALGTAALGFAVVASRRWCLRNRQDVRV
jgi:hypothetical protein